MAQQQREVEQHAHRDEEEAQQDVPERPDRCLDLMTELGLGQHHAREEGTERERQPDGMRGPGGGEDGEQHCERKEFRGAQLCDQHEQRPCEPAPGSEHESERGPRDHDGQRDLPRVRRLPVARQRGLERQQQREREVLEQADGHGEPAVGAVVLRLIGQLRDDDRGRGHRHGAADDHRDRWRDPEQHDRDAGDDRGRQRDLGTADAEHFAAHRDEPGQRELESEREDQEHHAEIGEQARGLVVGRQTERVGTQHEADREIAQDGGQRELAHGGDHDDRCREQDQHLEQRVAGMHGASPSYDLGRPERKYRRRCRRRQRRRKPASMAAWRNRFRST